MRMRKLRIFTREERGQAITEFALVAPLFLMLVFGIIDFGRFFYNYLQLQMAVQETVRLGGLGRTDAQIASFARSYVNLNDPAEVTVTVTPGDTMRDSGDYVTVTLTVPFQAVTPLIDDVFADVMNITAESTIRVE